MIDSINSTDAAIVAVIDLCQAITWDKCHKIYVLMDDNQINEMRGYGYDPIITSDEMSANEMVDQLKEWYASSCGLRFISAVASKKNGGDRFKDLIAQGDNWEGLDDGQI